MDLFRKTENEMGSVPCVIGVAPSSSANHLRGRWLDYTNKMRELSKALQVFERQMFEVAALVADSVDHLSKKSINSGGHPARFGDEVRRRIVQETDVPLARREPSSARVNFCGGDRQPQITSQDRPGGVIPRTVNVSAELNNLHTACALPSHSGTYGSVDDHSIPGPTDESVGEMKQGRAEPSVLSNLELKSSQEGAQMLAQREGTRPKEHQRAWKRAKHFLYAISVTLFSFFLLSIVLYVDWYHLGVHRTWISEWFLDGITSKCYDTSCNPPV